MIPEQRRSSNAYRCILVSLADANTRFRASAHSPPCAVCSTMTAVAKSYDYLRCTLMLRVTQGQDGAFRYARRADHISLLTVIGSVVCGPFAHANDLAAGQQD
jgi:hypothetical protein